MTSPERYRVCADVVSERLGDEEVVLHVGSGTYFQLNATGSIAWQRLKTASGSREELVAVVKARVANAPASVVTEIGELLAELVAAKLIEVVPL